MPGNEVTSIPKPGLPPIAALYSGLSDAEKDESLKRVLGFFRALCREERGGENGQTEEDDSHN